MVAAWDERVPYLGSLSFWHLVSALQRLGSGQRSSGVWFFLFLSVRSAPLAARKHAIDAEDFLSAPWLPRQIRSCVGQTEGGRLYQCVERKPR